jgi:hypothetical protein
MMGIERMPTDRKSVNHKFVIKNADKHYVSTGSKDEHGRELFVKVTSDLEGYLTAGMYPDGRLGELFLTVGKAGEVYRAFDAVMIAMSIGLQHGVPVEEFIQKFEFMGFEPSGFTKTKGIEITKSIMDYIARWLKQNFPKYQEK